MVSFRPLSGPAFAWAAARRAKYLVLATVLFLLLLLLAIPVLGIGIMLLMLLKPVIYVLFAASFLDTAIGRARHAGLLPLFAAGVPLLFLADLNFGIALGFPTGNDVLGWLSVRRMREPVFFLTAFAAVGVLCVVQGSEVAAPGWQARLGNLNKFAVAVVGVLLVAAVVGTMVALGSYMRRWALSNLLRLSQIGPLLTLVAMLGPLLLLPIGLREWRNAGRPGRQSIWFRAVAAVAVVICITSAITAVLHVAHWISPWGTMRAFDRAVETPLAVLRFVAVLAALSLPALIAKMLEGQSAAPAGNAIGPGPSRNGTSASRTSPGERPITAPVFGRRR